MAQSSYTLSLYQAQFQRAANTVPYVANTIVSNGSVLQIPTPDRAFYLRRLQINFSALTGGTSPTIRLHLFSADPTGGSFVATDAAVPVFTSLMNTYEGFIDTVVLVTNNIGSGDSSSTVSYILPSTISLYGLLETRTAFTPASAAIVRVRLYTETSN